MSRYSNFSIEEMKLLLDSSLSDLRNSIGTLEYAINRFNYDRTISVFHTVEEILEEAKERYVEIEDRELEEAGKELEKGEN